MKISLLKLSASRLVALMTLMAAINCAGYQDDRLRWCGDRLNPRDFGRAMRAATDMMLSCKDYIMKVNLSPLVLKEHRRLCIVLRICYSYASYHNKTTTQLRRTFLNCMEKMFHIVQAISPDLLVKLRLNVTAVVTAGTSCAFKHIPRQERYALAILDYFANFISG